jgi:hypothetical protein
MSSAVTGFVRIASELLETVESRAQLGEDVEGAMGSLQKFEALLYSEQPLDEPIHLFLAEEVYTDKPSLVSGICSASIETACSVPDH